LVIFRYKIDDWKIEKNFSNGHLDGTRGKQNARPYTNECKRAIRVDAEILMKLRCGNAIHKNFGGAIPLIQRDFLGKILWIGFL
jgi:hypothetical protein